MPTIQRQGLTCIGVAVTNLENDDAIQLALPFDRRTNLAVDAAVDKVRERFGNEAIKRAIQLGRDEGWSPPMLPD